MTTRKSSAKKDGLASSQEMGRTYEEGGGTENMMISRRVSELDETSGLDLTDSASKN